jgi:hypothetical protein
MKVRSLAVAVTAAGALAIGTASAAPASAASTPSPYPPQSCTSGASVTSTIVVKGATVTFSACGFTSGTVIIILLNGKTLTAIVAGLGGTVKVPVTPTRLGRNVISAVGARAGQAGRATARRASYATTSGLLTVPAAFDTPATLNVSAALDVVPRTVAAARPAAGDGHDGGLPLSGAEAGALAASALALAGGGTGLRMAARRRRSAAGRGDDA